MPGSSPEKGREAMVYKREPEEGTQNVMIQVHEEPKAGMQTVMIHRLDDQDEEERRMVNIRMEFRSQPFRNNCLMNNNAQGHRCQKT